MKNSNKNVLDTAASVAILVVAPLVLFNILSGGALGNIAGLGAKSGSGDALAMPAEWRELKDHAIRFGDPDASAVLMQFMDFTCPFCAQATEITDALTREFPLDLQVWHFHLTRAHVPGSEELAMLAECLATLGRGREAHAPLYRMGASVSSGVAFQTSVEEWFPHEAAGLLECVAREGPIFPRIAAGQALAREIGIRGTPSVWINGRNVGWQDVEGMRRLIVQISGGASAEP
jgi:protein-disulfide isomerase